MIHTRLSHIVALMLLIASSTAHAGRTSNTMVSSVTLTPDCTISLAPLSFTPSSALIQSNDDTTTLLQLNCTSGTPYAIALSAGISPGATTAGRRMVGSNGTSSVAYTISQDASHTQNWGDTLGTDTLPGVGTGVTVNVPVYSRIPAGQPAIPAMTYTDTVTATVSY